MTQRIPTQHGTAASPEQEAPGSTAAVEVTGLAGPFLTQAERRRWMQEYTRPWRTNPNNLPFVMTVGGSKIHRPSCWTIRENVRVADAIIDGATEAEARGNVPHPRWVDAPEPTCRICR